MSSLARSVALAAIAVLGSGATDAQHVRAAQGPRACPPKVPDRRTFARLPGHQSAPVIPARPRRVVVCHYGYLGQSFARAAMTGPGARALAEAMAHPGPQWRAHHACRPHLHATVTFEYASRPAVSVRIFGDESTGEIDQMRDWCGGAVGLHGARVVAIAQGIAVLLEASAGSGDPQTAQDGPRVPSLAGLSLRGAIRRAHRAGIPSPEVVGEVYAPGLRAGSVALQSPFPGRRTHGNSVDLKLAVGDAPLCRPGQVRAFFRPSGGPSVGYLFVRNTSATACRVAGDAFVSGVNAHGRRLTQRRRSHIPVPAVLPARPLSRQGWLAPSIVITTLPFVQNQPDGQPCPRLITPRLWRIAIPGGIELDVRNRDPTASGPLYGAVQSCRGGLSVADLFTG